MRKAVFAFAGMMAAAPVLAVDTYTIDPNHTFPNFTINHLGFSTMHGRFGKTSGSLTMDEKRTTGSVEIVIDASSVDTGMAKRNDHLRSPDFLNAAEFPEITYKSTKVTFNGEHKATVEGNLTIKGVTKPVKLDVQSVNCGINPMDPTKKKFVCGFDATAKIKRSDFDVTFALPAIGNDMNLSLEVEAERN
ncbi:MAG: putative signal peptide protein [Gammaproteobacteria bacterium]|nr:MAG: putative signal peptide protein [Gammaproteobacteria bacterium]TND02198.1 MAG: putative signal peptide protein [Gammaproteobacteria bacterium]